MSVKKFNKDAVALKKRLLIPEPDPFTGHFGAVTILRNLHNLQFQKLPKQRQRRPKHKLIPKTLETDPWEDEIITKLLKSPNWKPIALLTLGQSLTKVYVIRKSRKRGKKRAEYVVKFGRPAIIQAEVDSYWKSRKWRHLDDAAKLIKSSPVNNGGLSGLIYELVGKNKDKVVSLGQYLQNLKPREVFKDEGARIDDLNDRFEKVIVQTLEAAYKAWKTDADPNPISPVYTFDRVLPILALLQKTKVKDSTKCNEVSATDLIKNQLANLKPNKVLILKNFVVEEIKEVGNCQEITLNIPANQHSIKSNYERFCSNGIRLRIPKSEGGVYHEGQHIDQIEAKVIETRPDTFQTELKKIPILSHFNLNDDYFEYEKSDGQFRNPFEILDWVLQEYLSKDQQIYIGEIHGDFHVHNIIVHKDDGHLLGFIDFARVHYDYVLHDFLRLERSLITWVFKGKSQGDNLAEAIELYRELDYAWRNIPKRFEEFSPDSRSFFADIRTNTLKRLPPNSQPIFAAILAIRQFAYDFLASKDHQEYYAGLLVYLLSSLKFHDETNKVAAFGASLAVAEFIVAANNL